MVIPLGDTPRTATLPVVTIALIALNVMAWIAQVVAGPSFTAAYAATPWEIARGEDLTETFELVDRSGGPPAVVVQGPVPFPVGFTLLTALFLHDGPLHLAINMLFLWIYGDNVEEALGPARFLAFYLACGLLGMSAQVAAAPNSLVPILGASGAVAGVMGAYVIWFPYNRVRLWFLRIFEVPAIWVVGLWIAAQLARGFLALEDPSSIPGVAYLAHVTGASLGLLVGLAARSSIRRPGAGA